MGTLLVLITKVIRLGDPNDARIFLFAIKIIRQVPSNDAIFFSGTIPIVY